jgi:uncharacterized membrane protein YhaH (DUF805 family)
VAKYRYVAGFWLSLLFAAWCLYSLGHGLVVVANNPDKYVNDVMIPTLALLAGLAALFIWLALRVRRKGGDVAEPS